MSIFFKSDLYKTLCSIYNEERVLNYIDTLKKLEDPRGYSTFDKSTAWCEDVLKKEGFSDVRRIAHKADGETASYDFIMPQAWDLCGRSTLEIVEPINEMIADSDISTLYISEYSAPTPAGGITAELVDYATLDPKNPDCKGKYVFYRGYLPPQNPLCVTLAGAGCAGIVFAAFNASEHEPGVPSWTNGHGKIGWYNLKEDPMTSIFCVSCKTGMKLIDLLAKGKVVLHGVMDTKLYDGEIYTVTATIPGKSDDEFAILAHLYEPFYSDDSQGFGVGVEVAIMLKKLIEDGVLPKPEKTLRLIFSMERYGFAAFFANHDKKILAAASIDTLTCLATEMLKTPFTIKESPLSNPFFGDMLFQVAMDNFCPDVNWTLACGNMSDDCWQAEPSVDIPTTWCVSSCAYNRGDYHHADAPIFDGMIPELMAKLVPMVAAYTAVLVCGDREHFAKMAKELEPTAAKWLELRKNYIAGLAGFGKLAKIDAMWRNKAAETLYLGRMNSFNRFFPGIVTPTLPAHWADEYCANLPERELSAAEKKASSVRYRVIAKGLPFSQARVPVAERKFIEPCHEMTWGLLSPERTALDAIRLRDAAHNTRTSDEGIEKNLEYFAFLTKYGYLEEVK